MSRHRGFGPYRPPVRPALMRPKGRNGNKTLENVMITTKQVRENVFTHFLSECDIIVTVLWALALMTCQTQSGGPIMRMI